MIRVLLADDQALIRAGFRLLLDTADDIEVIGEACDGGAAVGGEPAAWPRLAARAASGPGPEAGP